MVVATTSAMVHTSSSAAPAPPIAATPQHLVVLGDSVPAGSACDCGGFGVMLASTISAPLTNLSVPGLTSHGLVAQLSSGNVQAALGTATVVTVTIGANDFNEGDADARACSDLSCYTSTMKTVTSNINSIVTRIKALTPSGTTIVVTGYWNVFLDGRVGAAKGRTYVATSDALSRALNSRLASLSVQHDVLYTDVYTPFKGTGTLDDSALLAGDGDHPNAAGHELIAEAIEATLLGDTGRQDALLSVTGVSDGNRQTMSVPVAGGSHRRPLSDAIVSSP